MCESGAGWAGGRAVALILGASNLRSVGKPLNSKQPTNSKTGAGSGFRISKRPCYSLFLDLTSCASRRNQESPGEDGAARAVVADVSTRLAGEASQTRETPMGTTGSSNGVSLTQRASSAPAEDAAMADVVDALQTGHSIRDAARTDDGSPLPRVRAGEGSEHSAGTLQHDETRPIELRSQGSPGRAGWAAYECGADMVEQLR